MRALCPFKLDTPADLGGLLIMLIDFFYIKGTFDSPFLAQSESQYLTFLFNWNVNQKEDKETVKRSGAIWGEHTKARWELSLLLPAFHLKLTWSVWKFRLELDIVTRPFNLQWSVKNKWIQGVVNSRKRVMEIMGRDSQSLMLSQQWCESLRNLH